MKKYLAAIALVGILAACGGGSGSAGNKDSAAAPATTDITTNPDYVAGLALIGKNDCLTCHKVSEKLVGPAYTDVAYKYAGSDTALEYLSKKVVAGGSGVWGQIPMAAHPMLPLDSAKQIVKYILLLKTK